MTTEDDKEEVGIAIPATMGMLGLAFIGCALVIAGLPPLSGFIAKFALLTAALSPSDSRARGGAVPLASWALLVMLILSGLAAHDCDDSSGHPRILGGARPRRAARAG